MPIALPSVLGPSPVFCGAIRIVFARVAGKEVSIMPLVPGVRWGCKGVSMTSLLRQDGAGVGGVVGGRRIDWLGRA